MSERASRILVVDYRVLARKTLGLLLKRLGYEAIEAKSAEGAIAAARREHPDAILISVELPAISGIEAMRILSKDPTTRSIPIVAMGSYATKERVFGALSAGARDFIVLPTVKAATIALKLRAAFGSADTRVPPAPPGEREEGPGEDAGRTQEGEEGPLGGPDEGSSRRQAILRKIDKAARHRNISGSVVGLFHMILGPDASPAEIASAIEGDPGLSSRVLRTVNASFFGHANPIADVRQGVLQIGITGVRDIILWNEFFLPFFSSRSHSGGLADLWEHSFSTAAIARNLARILRPKELGAVYLAGLLHDIGRSLLARLADEGYEKNLSTGASRAPTCAEEKEILGIDHAAAGARFLRGTRLPTLFGSVAELHHADWAILRALDDSHLFPTAIIRAADAVAHALGLGSAGPVDPVPIPEDAARSLEIPLSLDGREATVGVAEELDRLWLLQGRFHRADRGWKHQARNGDGRTVLLARERPVAIDPVGVALESAGFRVLVGPPGDVDASVDAIVVAPDGEDARPAEEKVLSAIEEALRRGGGPCIAISPRGPAADAYARAGARVVAAPFLRRDLIDALLTVTV